MQGSTRRAATRVHRRVTRMLWLTVLLCMLSALAAQQWMGREALRQQSLQTALDHGRRVVQLIDQHGTSTQRRESALNAYAEQHQLQGLVLTDPDGRVVYRREAAPPVEALPSALKRWLLPSVPWVEMSLPPPPGSAVGARLGVQASALVAADVLWRQSLQFAIALAVALGTVLALGLWLAHGLHRQVERLAREVSSSRPDSQASSQPALSTTSRDAEPSERRVRKMARLEGLVVAQAREIDELRRKAHVDELTGLASRRQVMVRLEDALDGEAAPPAAALLLLRVRDLAGANRRVGHDVANEVLQAVARAIQAEAEPAEHALAGRLNGADFVLMLPGARPARAVADAVVARLRHELVELDPNGGLAIGAVDLGGRVGVRKAMALADEALAVAEAEAMFAVSTVTSAPDVVAFGDTMWQQRLTAALQQRRLALAGYPVCAADGRVLYLDCPMRVQFDDGEYESASRWLAPALRGQLNPEIDLRVVQMALAAIHADEQERCVNLSAQSMASADFVLNVTRELEAAPGAARRLWVDLPESLAVQQPALVAEAARRWGALGVRLALEHAGERLDRIDELGSLGVACVRIDSRFVRGLTGAESTHARRHLMALVELVHRAGLTIAAEGVALAGDLALLWTMGFDAATGPAVLKRGHSMSPQ